MDIAHQTATTERLNAFAEKFARTVRETGRPRVSFNQPQKYGGTCTGITAKLETSEYEELLSILENGKTVLIFEPFSMGMMDFSLRIWSHPPAPGTDPVLLFTLGGESLPDCKRIVVQKSKCAGCILDDAWDAYSPFSHTEENKKWLKEYKMEQAHHFDHYDY